MDYNLMHRFKDSVCCLASFVVILTIIIVGCYVPLKHEWTKIDKMQSGTCKLESCTGKVHIPINEIHNRIPRLNALINISLDQYTKTQEIVTKDLNWCSQTVVTCFWYVDDVEGSLSIYHERINGVLLAFMITAISFLVMIIIINIVYLIRDLFDMHYNKSG